jgi:hypothetical protein
VPRGINDGSARLDYGGTWREVEHGSYWGDSAHTASRAGRDVRLSFTGGGAAIVAALGPTRGSFRVYVDGELRRTVKTHAGSTAYRQVVYTVQWPEIGEHRIRLVVVGTDGHPRVDLDGILVLGAP